jgi:hypothetical protein
MKAKITADEAEMIAAKWLADGNAADEKGNPIRAEKCWEKAQFWLDRANALRRWN